MGSGSGIGNGIHSIGNIHSIGRLGINRASDQNNYIAAVIV
jgi:hypothetical protein